MRGLRSKSSCEEEKLGRIGEKERIETKKIKLAPCNTISVSSLGARKCCPKFQTIVESNQFLAPDENKFKDNSLKNLVEKVS